MNVSAESDYLMAFADPAKAIAANQFNIPYLYPYQRFVIGAILDRLESTPPEKMTVLSGKFPAHQPPPGSANYNEYPAYQVVLLPTGAGKSLCFQLPALLSPKPTLVIFPLLGLMSDQQRRLEVNKVPCAVLRGGMTRQERQSIFAGLSDGSIRMLLANPEILAIPSVLEQLKMINFFHCVIDEAHCVAEWGDSFRPSYLQLGDIIRQLKPDMVTAFTATASSPILTRLVEVLFDNQPFSLIQGNADRPNLFYEVWSGLSPSRLLRQAIRQALKPLIIFTPSRTGVELTARQVLADFPEIPVRFYHAGLERSEKQQIEQWFFSSQDGILCATCAYGMGMDKPNIRSVIHTDAPASIEAYLQEAGRAGRDGQPAKAILLAAMDQPAATTAGSAGAGSAPMPSTKESSTNYLQAQRKQLMQHYASQTTECRRAFLLRALDAESPVCSGCDICTGQLRSSTPTRILLQDFFGRHRRRFTKLQAKAYLAGSAKAPYYRDHACLSEWAADEIDEALDAGIACGWLEESQKIGWKHCLQRPKVAAGLTRGKGLAAHSSSSSSSKAERRRRSRF